MKKSFLIILSFLIYSCGTTVKVQKYPVENLKISRTKKSVLIVPFESYSLNPFSKQWIQTNILIYNYIADNFIIHNILPVPFQDVFNKITEEKGINDKNSKISPTLFEELNNPEWSYAMKEEISKIIEEKKRKNFNQLKYLKLSDNFIFNLAKEFNADYIVKGEIVRLTINNEETYNPFKIGLINAPTKLVSRFLFGRPESNNWEMAQNVFTSASIAAAIGYNIDTPFGPGHKKTTITGHPLFGTKTVKRVGEDADFDFKNSLFWGSAIGFATFLGAHGGSNPEVNVALRIYIYEAKSNKLVWTNSINLYASPDVCFCDQNLYELTSKALESSIDEIFKSFWKTNSIIISQGE